MSIWRTSTRSKTTSSSWSTRSTRCLGSRTPSPGSRTSASPRPTRATSSEGVAASRCSPAAGATLFGSGNSLEHLTARLGHYPESRSENKGNEPEGIEYGEFGSERYLFVGSERSSVIFVYDLADEVSPELVQVLPAGVAPEGLLAIPERDLFVVACEEDARDDKIRSVMAIYERVGADSSYPAIKSADRGDGKPIPWGALSALVVDPMDDSTLYSVHDSYYTKTRVFELDRSGHPAIITGETALSDTTHVLLGELQALEASLPPTATDDFDPLAIVNADLTVNLDGEGVAALPDGSFWIASEGAGNLVGGVSNPEDQPFRSPNALVKVDADGHIVDVALLPQAIIENQFRFGFEGVAVDESEGTGEVLYVAFQRAWQDAGDPADHVRIGRYDTATGEWTFAYYPLDTPTSPAGGWVGLSEITHVGNDTFVVIERDNQANHDATIKRVYSFSTDAVTFQDDSQAGAFDVVAKHLERDLIAYDDFGPTGGLVLEKLEGLAVLSDGTALIVNDNDGTDDSNGETQLLSLGTILQ